MSQQQVARMIADHQGAIARHENPLTHETICEVLHDLEALAITEGQAIKILATTGARIDDPARQALYRQAIAELRQVQADEH
jgi:hypothetical protein